MLQQPRSTSPPVDDPHDDWSDPERLDGLHKKSADRPKRTVKRTTGREQQPDILSKELGAEKTKEEKNKEKEEKRNRIAEIKRKEDQEFIKDMQMMSEYQVQ